MEHPIKTNRMALISFICGWIALLSTGLVFALYGLLPPTEVSLIITDSILIPLRNISAVAGIITGILAHRAITQKDGTEKGKGLAWAGIILGAAWLLIGICTGLVFLLSMVAQHILGSG